MYSTLFLEKQMMKADRAAMLESPVSGSVLFSIFKNLIVICKG